MPDPSPLTCEGEAANDEGIPVSIDPSAANARRLVPSPRLVLKVERPDPTGQTCDPHGIGVLGQAEIAEGEEFLDGDAKHQLRQVGSDAPVRPCAEADMPVGMAVEDHLVRIGELFLIPVP